MHFSIESKIIRDCFKKLGFKKIKLLFYLYNNDMNEHFIIFFLVCILLHHKIVIKKCLWNLFRLEIVHEPIASLSILKDDLMPYSCIISEYHGQKII